MSKNNTKKKAVVLLSGGLDSATTLAIAKEAGFLCYAMSFRYGQRAEQELKSASDVAKMFSVEEHRVIDLDLGSFGGSALVGDGEVPKGGTIEGEIPITYVPARNTVFLSYALAWAEVLGAWDIFIGASSVDYSGYPDCRGEFLDSFSTLANLATRAAVEGEGVFEVRAPLLKMTKAEIIQKGLLLGVDYSLTHSCYDPTDEGVSCGQCDSCLLRLRGFSEANFKDPIKYKEGENL